MCHLKHTYSYHKFEVLSLRLIYRHDDPIFKMMRCSVLAPYIPFPKAFRFLVTVLVVDDVRVTTSKSITYCLKRGREAKVLNRASLYCCRFFLAPLTRPKQATSFSS